MVEVQERLARIEGGYEHMATKADVAFLKWAVGVNFAINLLIPAKLFEIIPV